MSILYDSKRRRVQPWIPIAFILIPVVILSLAYFLTKDKVQEFKSQKDQKQQEDIFDRF